MDRGVEEPLAPTLGALAVTGILFDVGDHAGIENALPIMRRIPPDRCKKLCLICPLSGYCRIIRRSLGLPYSAIAIEYLSSVAGGMHHLSRRCPWLVIGDKTITS